MCGIAGVISLEGRPLETDRLKAMTDVVAHRGPDDGGYLLADVRTGRAEALTDAAFRTLRPDLPVFEDPAGQRLVHDGPWSLFFGHRRLSILDLSPRGHQPMANPAGDVWIVYNGEVYNFRELRAELEALGQSFTSTSDTEVVLRAYEVWGLEMIRRLNGMFALAIWDARKQQAIFVRDRFGIKPLYTLQREGRLYFGSEIKSILAALDRAPGVDLLAMNEYFSFQNVFSDRTLFEGVRLLPPGHLMIADLRTGQVRRKLYWDFDFEKEIDESPDVVRDRLAAAIRHAVNRQCVSDVPVGSYLSGGMDSGTITALTAETFGRIFTFTGGFDLSEAADHEQHFDERELAERMANLFQTEHYECVLHSGDMEAVMERLIWHLEDPRVGQCYPNFYISRLAGKFVKVVLCGTGGDELFGGYPWRYAAAVGGGPDNFVENYYRYWQRLVSNREKLRFYNPDTLDRLKAIGTDEARPFENHTLNAFRSVLALRQRPRSLSEQVDRALYFECKTFLHGLLVVEDKLSMAHSLETRVPFLDNELVDLACRIPVRLKVAGIDNIERQDENLPRKEYYRQKMHTGKNILRQSMERLLPPDIVNARKQGFSAPDESWFRGRSEQYVRDRLLSAGAMLHDYVSPQFIDDALTIHSSGQKNKRLLIWSLLSFEYWLRVFQPRLP
jgi:asparagine synthase (glutamine-hydrolysing)